MQRKPILITHIFDITPHKYLTQVQRHHFHLESYLHVATLLLKSKLYNLKTSLLTLICGLLYMNSAGLHNKRSII